MPILLHILEIAIISDKQSVGLNQKAKRQRWAFHTDNKNPGSPIHIYPLERLPDGIQIAWAGWDDEKYNQARIKEELKGESGRVNKIPPPILEEEASQALAMPIREFWFKQYPVGQKPKKGRRVYDGESVGFCQPAREILFKRFPNLINEAISEIINKPSIQDETGLKSANSKPPVQPDLPPRTLWRKEVPFDTIRRRSRICTKCEFGDYMDGNPFLIYCPHCSSEDKLICECPSCNAPIMYPYANRCTQCKTIFRKKPAPLPK